ncbi:MAG: sulfite exporter TauE/SafE family protein [Chloroflexi bacterium]|nr:sulfite exporter TauE/SafE family protein [Chloroflexota bacterium]
MIFAEALVMGGLVGILTGLFGVGGGFLITPLLNIVLHIPMPIAVGTSAMQILGVSTAGLYCRRREGTVDYKMAIMLFGGNLVGVRLGVRTLERMKGLGDIPLNGNALAAADFYILCIFFVMLGAIAAWILYDTTRNTQRPDVHIGLFAHIHLPPYASFGSLEERRLSIPVMCYFGLALGFMTGLLGIGGGVILLPALVYLVGMRTHCATATSLALVWASSFIATIEQSLAGNANLLLAIPLLMGGTLGIQLGVKLASRLGGPKLRQYFSLVVIATMVLVAARIVSVAV